MIPGNEDSKFQTKVISSNLNPVWDDEEYEADNYARGDRIDFTVFDHDKMGALTSWVVAACLAETLIATAASKARSASRNAARATRQR